MLSKLQEYEHELERMNMEAEQIKARNLESIGILAGGIAHDFNNLFQGILGNISLAKFFLPASCKAFQFLENAEKVSQQATKLTGQLICFSRGDCLFQGKIQVASHIQEAVEATLNGSNLALTFDPAPDLWPVTIAPFQFRQVIHHLLTNAQEAMPTGGRLQICVVNDQLPGGERSHPLPSGNYVKISIRDHGSGIHQGDLPRIFDPYFSTKQRGAQKGMGLGLTLCHTIIRKHGGAITVETERGQGTTVHVHLPAATIAAEMGTIAWE